MKVNALSRRSFVQSAGVLCASAVVGAPGVALAAQGVKIGFLGPLSGPLARVAETNRNALAIAVDEINATGGLLGREVEVVSEDSQMSTKVSLDKARKLIGRDQVSVLIGMVLPFEREAALQAASAAKRLVIYPNFDEGRCHPQLLTTGLALNQRVEPAVEWVTKNVGKKFAVLASDLGSNRQGLVPQLQAALERHGGSVVSVRYFPFGTSDYGPVFQQLQGQAPDVIWHSIGDDPITFVKQYRSFGMKPQLLTDITHESLAIATEGASVGNIGVSAYFMSLDNPTNKRFLETFTERFPHTTPHRVGGHVVMLPHGESTYVGAKLYGEAVKRAGSTDVAKVKQALEKIAIDAPRGPVRVAANGTHLHCATLLGRARPDNTFEQLGSFGPVAAACAAS